MSVKSAIRLEKYPPGDKEKIHLPAKSALPERRVGEDSAEVRGSVSSSDEAVEDEDSPVLLARGQRIACGRRPLLMGIVNINADSFSGDGRLDAAWALDQARRMVGEGADIIDVGGESARTNRSPVSEEEEWRRIAPFLEGFEREMRDVRPRSPAQVFPPLLSVNTWRTGVVARAVECSCDLLNDMSALPDATHARLCHATGTALLIMHSKGQPKVPHTHVRYLDIMDELETFFESRLAIARSAGLSVASCVIDPGLDFAKPPSDNLRILRELRRLARFRCPILLPVSRKGTIGSVLGIEDPSERDAGTTACVVAGVLRGASILRVHNVDAAWLAVRTVLTVESCSELP